VLSRTLLASLLSVSALGAMPSGAGVVFASSSAPAAHHADGHGAKDGQAADHRTAASHRHRHVHH
jgi:hypothetical protein